MQMIMDLIPTIESTIEHQRTIQLRPLHAHARKFQASGPAQIYITLVQDKFPKANEKLQQRLGEANWQRHLNIRRRIEHEGRRQDVADVKATETGSLFRPQTLFHGSGVGTTIGSQSQSAQTGASHTSFMSSVGTTLGSQSQSAQTGASHRSFLSSLGTTIGSQSQSVQTGASHRSFMSSIAEAEKGHLRVPPTPIEVEAGKPFRCQLCGIMQTKIRNRIDWKYVTLSPRLD